MACVRWEIYIFARRAPPGEGREEINDREERFTQCLPPVHWIKLKLKVEKLQRSN